MLEVCRVDRSFGRSKISKQEEGYEQAEPRNWCRGRNRCFLFFYMLPKQTVMSLRLWLSLRVLRARLSYRNCVVIAAEWRKGAKIARDGCYIEALVAPAEPLNAE